MQKSTCFHCALPLDGAAFPVTVGGETRTTCCAGCQAVAQTIVDNGLADYYRNRTAAPPRTENPRRTLATLELYDVPDVQRSFVRVAHDDVKEASLLLDGLTCAACAWLIERRLAKVHGVVSVAINYAARRARVAYDGRTTLSAILRAIAGLGYGVQPYDAARSEEALHRERRTMLRRLFVAGFGMMQVMMYAVPVYVADGAMTPDIEQLMRLASLVLTAPVALWAALPFYRGALRELRARRIGMDLAVAAGIAVAFAVSLAATWRGSGDVYFDSVTMFVFLLLGSRYLEMNARIRAADAQARLARLAPATAEKLASFPEPGVPQVVAAAALRPGDVVAVRPGASIPADGTVLEGASAADESLFTGESRPVAKTVGSRVTGGSVNVRSPLTMRVDRVGEDSVLAGIVRLMDRAQTEKPPIALAAERAAQWFVAAVLALTIASAIAWYAVDPSRALWIAIAVLVVTCPCALSLATPAVLTAATGALYRQGMLVTRGHALETLAHATHFVFDKTGTLTTGHLSLIGVLPLSDLPRGRCLEIAAALEAQSEHPLARAIAAAAPHINGHATDVENAPGCGVSGVVDGVEWRIGTPAYVAALHGRPLPRELAFVSDDVSMVALGNAQGWVSLLTFDDELRGDARRVVAELAAGGRTVCLLSGDRERRARHVARELGIPVVRGDATPQDKLAFVERLQAQGAIVAMVGDGVNDAPVLGLAQVSVAMGCGTELAHASADMVLMHERLQPLADAFSTARRALRIVRQNLAWAGAYNAVALPLAIAGCVTPLVAAIGMSASSLVVVTNALRLLRVRRVDTDGAAPVPRITRAAASI
ncbi:MAG TPA: heavy metal translocating P-type ATPase [Burkholderiales bacterium]|nr:heavy metal translocating P-type ATPase [Burkholderiales bacterium]